MRPASAAMTALFTVHAQDSSWPAAIGHLLTFHIYSEPDAAADFVKDGSTSFHRLRDAALDWADLHSLAYPDSARSGVWFTLSPDPSHGLSGARPGVGRAPDKWEWESVEVLVRFDDAALIEDLARTLSALPGVSQPVVERELLHFGNSGIEATLVDSKVIFNGVTYRFPEDFDASEVRELAGMFRYLRKYGPDYRAFSVRLLNDYGRRESRFEFGDVVRRSLDAEGNLVISDVVKEWKIPESAEPFKRHGTGQLGGWGFNVPRGMDESQIDVLAEFARIYEPQPGDQGERDYTISISYWLIPFEQILSQGGGSVSEEQAQAARALGEKLLAVSQQYVSEHPEYRRGLIFRDRLNASVVPWGSLAGQFNIGASVDHPDELQPLVQRLAAAGAPEPDVQVTQMSARRKAGEREAEELNAKQAAERENKDQQAQAR